ncbi:hypothetical protein D0Z00_003241 [Geotrichum galactomycetum]|uniref:Uncharacterized protein n=1 Tax=Geotrichum galactomycetum TaxID=27317 RepID=A0ACB6V1X6_9ASCO|nr:hypothetical protein D0Z00_003241 [Geotrichum candidum]
MLLLLMLRVHLSSTIYLSRLIMQTTPFNSRYDVVVVAVVVVVVVVVVVAAGSSNGLQGTDPIATQWSV